MGSLKRLTIVDYGMGNLGAIANIVRKVGGEAQVTSDADELARAEKLLLPGVGAFDTGMRQLAERNLVEVLGRRARGDGIPILGICLGMQLLTTRSDEGKLAGLGWIRAETRRFRFDGPGKPPPVPHMGWNDVSPSRSSRLLRESEGPWRFYFVHSYHLQCSDVEDVVGTTTYGYPFVSAIERGNIFGVQFHPEKSHSYGMKLLRGFLEL